MAFWGAAGKIFLTSKPEILIVHPEKRFFL